MSMQEDIQDLVLGFFNAIKADIINTDNEAYVVRVPESYQHAFGGRELHVVFDRDAVSEHDYELVAPGNRILSQIIEICTDKGPVKVKNSDNSDNNATIRYHFFIHFSGRSDRLALDRVDVELTIKSDTSILGHDGASHPLNWMNPDEVTRTYSVAIKELQTRHDVVSLAFLHDANQRFGDDVQLFTEKYDLRVRELDHSINRKDRESSDSDKAREFRFQVADEISASKKKKRV